MKANGFVFAVALVLTLNSRAYADTAEGMLAACREIAQAPVFSGEVSLPTTFSAGRCWAAFDVLQELAGWRDETHEPYIPQLRCVPTQVTRTTWAAVFVAYLDKHPEKRTDSFAAVAVKAMSEAYPCH